MKFMITYSYSADNFLPVVEAWGSLLPQERASVGEGSKKIGHWHDVVGRRAFLCVEFERILGRPGTWGLGWNSSRDATITPVLDDEEAGFVARLVATDRNA